MDEKVLSTLGLNAKEIKLFKAVLKSRELSPAQLAKMVSIKRTTCYSLARGLVEKGFLVENAGKRPRTFSLSQPGDAERTLHEERKRLTEREKILKRFTGELSRATAEDSYPVPQIRFVEEERMEHFLDSQSFKWDESMLKTDGTWWGFQDHTYAEHFSHVIDSYWRRTPENITLKLLSNQSVVEHKLKGKYPRRQIKVWNKATNFLSSIWVVGDFVMMVNTRKHPFYLVEIQDATLAHDLREVFKNLWALV